jgi:hypothetical protein
MTAMILNGAAAPDHQRQTHDRRERRAQPGGNAVPTKSASCAIQPQFVRTGLAPAPLSGVPR